MDTEAGALSVDDAVAHLMTGEAADDQPETTDAPEIEEDDAPETVSDDDDQEEATEDESEDQSEDEPETPAIDPPKSWDAEHKAKWDALPRDVQEYLSTREQQRDQGVSTAQQRASEARQRAEQEAQALAAFKPQLEGLLTQAQQQFQTRWQGMDATAWQHLAQTDPGRYVQAKAAYDADVQAQQQLDAARQQVEAVEYQTFAQTQTARLPEIAPHLVDQKAQAEVFDYIAKNVPNTTPETLKWISADEFVIAWKAAQYDKAQAPQPKPQGKKVPQAKPGAPPVPQRQLQRSKAEQAFSKAPTIENAMRLLS